MSKTASASPAAATIAHLARLVSTPTGLDGGLQAAQYSSPIWAALLLRLARARREHPMLAKAGAAGDGARLTQLAAGVVNAGASIGEARVVMRAFGLLPMLDWLLKIHPKPLNALANFFLRPSLANLDLRNEKVFQTVRVMLLSAFYVLEHTAWLATKGVLRLTPEQIQRTTMWSIRSWAIDVYLSAIKLLVTRSKLLKRSAALKASTSEVGDEVKGYSLTPQKDSEEAKALDIEWRAWTQQAMVNFGWIPLTVHWATGGLWANPLITAAVGSWVSYGKLRGAWLATN